MDKLDKAIADKRRELDQLREVVARQQRAVELATAELGALELAAQMRPSTARGDTPARRGRQPGAISKAWREVLAQLHVMSGPYTYEQIAEIAAGCGIEAEMSSIRDRVRRFQELGFMAGNPQLGFHVSEDAVSRFDLSTERDLGL